MQVIRGHIQTELLKIHPSSLAVQWLEFLAFTAEGPVSIPSQELKILKQKKKIHPDHQTLHRSLLGTQNLSSHARSTESDSTL